MCDLFSSKDAQSVLHKKKILFLGDSNIRSFYKDLVFLFENNRLISKVALKNKLGSVVSRDVIVSNSKLHRGRDYFEVREYKNNNVHVTFHFLTKCFTKVVNEMFQEFKANKAYPDIVIMNSCLWDICRWGPNGVLDYKDNIVKLMKLAKSCLPEETLFIWTCAPPISDHCKGGLLVKQVQFLEHSLRFDVMEGNMFAREMVVSHGFDVLDIHYYLRMQLHWRAEDGIHWLPHAVRHVTNLILTHVCVAFNLKLPGNIKSESIQRFKSLAMEMKKEVKENKLPHIASVIVRPEIMKPKPLQTRQMTELIREERVILSPLRKAIKEKIKYSLRDRNEHHGEDSLLDLSLASEDLNDSFKLDISLEIPLQQQCQGLGVSFEETACDVNALPRSPIPSYKEHERKEWTGPIRFRKLDRKNRTHRVPYAFH